MRKKNFKIYPKRCIKGVKIRILFSKTGLNLEFPAQQQEFLLPLWKQDKMIISKKNSDLGTMALILVELFILLLCPLDNPNISLYDDVTAKEVQKCEFWICQFKAK